MKKVKIVFLVSIFIYAFAFSTKSQTTEKISEKKFTKIELQKDFNQLQKLIEDNFTALYEFNTEEDFDNFRKKQYEQIKDNLTLRDFYNICSPIVAKIGCGHTSISYPRQYFGESSMKFFPIKISWVDDKLFVVKNVGKETISPKSEILTINKVPVADIYKKISNSISADGLNQSFIKSVFNQRFFYYYVLTYGFYEKFEIAYKKPNSNSTNEMSVDAIKIDFSKYSDLFPDNALLSLSFNINKPNEAAYIKVPNFAFYKNPQVFKNYIDSCFTVIKDKKINNLVVDLRGNDGGDPFCSSYLFSYLISTPTPYFAGKYRTKPFDYDTLALPIKPKENNFTGNLFVLADGLCYSSTGHLLALIKYHKLGKIVGQEAGSNYMCFGDTESFTLKNTKINLRVSRAKRCVAVEGFTIKNGIIPDYEIKTSIDDLIENKDVVLENTMKLIRENK